MYKKIWSDKLRPGLGNPESVRVVKTSQGLVSFIKIFLVKMIPISIFSHYLVNQYDLHILLQSVLRCKPGTLLKWSLLVIILTYELITNSILKGDFFFIIKDFMEDSHRC